MNKKMLVLGIVAILVIAGGVSLLMNNANTTTMTNTAAVVGTVQSAPTTATVQTAPSVPLMQSTGAAFAGYKYVSKAHEIFPTLASETKAALGAFSYTKTDLGNGVSRFTLTNSAEGYKGQSVVVGADQKLYFIEPSKGDDSASEDSITTDDFFVVVDAQGNILK